MPTTPNVPVMEAYPDRILARLEERDRRRAGVTSRLRDTLAREDAHRLTHLPAQPTPQGIGPYRCLVTEPWRGGRMKRQPVSNHVNPLTHQPTDNPPGGPTSPHSP